DRVGDYAKKDELLLQLDERQQKAELKVRQAALVAAKAQWEKVEFSPREEEVPPQEARVAELKAAYDDAKDQSKRALRAPKAISVEDTSRRKFASLVAEAQWHKAVADLYLLRKGAWKRDKLIARTAVEQAQAQVDQANTELERLKLLAPIRGKILQINV